MRTKRAFFHDTSGAYALEFALVAPVVVGILILALEVGLQLATDVALQNGAADAVRFALTGNSSVTGASGAPSCRAQSIPWIVINEAPSLLSAENLTVTSSVGSASAVGSTGSGFAGTKSATVTYLFTYTQPYITPLASYVMGSKAVVHTVTLLGQNEAYPTSGC